MEVDDGDGGLAVGVGSGVGAAERVALKWEEG